MNEFKLSVKQVCKLCGFSERTFFNRTRAGIIKVVRDNENLTRAGLPRIFVMADVLADYLGITDESVARELFGLPPIAPPEPTPEDRDIFANVDAAPRVPAVHEPLPHANFTDDAAENQARWNAGEVTDSMGNRAYGGSVSLLGPKEPQPRIKPDSTSHMHPALIGGGERVENPVDSDAFQELLHPGFLERKAQMYRDAGIREPSEQDKKKCLDRAAIAAAFRQGYSR